MSETIIELLIFAGAVAFTVAVVAVNEALYRRRTKSEANNE